MTYLIAGAIFVVLASLVWGLSAIRASIREGGARSTREIVEALRSFEHSAPPETPSEQYAPLDRLEALERRIEGVQDDVLRNLAKANTRLRRARQLAGDEVEEDEPEATPEQLAQAQLELAQPESPGTNGPLSMEQLRSIANGGL